MQDEYKLFVAAPDTIQHHDSPKNWLVPRETIYESANNASEQVMRKNADAAQVAAHLMKAIECSLGDERGTSSDDSDNSSDDLSDEIYHQRKSVSAGLAVGAGIFSQTATYQPYQWSIPDAHAGDPTDSVNCEDELMESANTERSLVGAL